jgi:hypothetical protein
MLSGTFRNHCPGLSETRILDSNDREILAFTPRGIEALWEIIDDQIDKTG